MGVNEVEMEDIIYWVWLSEVFSIGSNKGIKVINEYGGAKEFYERVTRGDKIDILGEKDIGNARRTSKDRAEMIIERCISKGIKIITIADEAYPNRLRNLSNPPIVIYVLGDIGDIDNEVTITIVGTRKPSEYGKRVTGNISYELARAGVTIVSGCAVGIDSYAHIGALKGNGKTIGVLGCGLDVDYPKENFELKQAILKKGGLISELPPMTRPNPRIFPIRNRIMAALCLGIVVGEAPIKSGSLITVNQGLEMGKDIFCVPPRDIYDPKYGGVTKYINDGAIMVGNSKIIIDEYIDMFPHKLDITKIKSAYIIRNGVNEVEKGYLKVADNNANYNVKKDRIDILTEEDKQSKKSEIISKLREELEEEDIRVCEVLDFEGKHVDQISEESGLEISDVLCILTELEILGLVESTTISYYRLVSE